MLETDRWRVLVGITALVLVMSVSTAAHGAGDVILEYSPGAPDASQGLRLLYGPDNPAMIRSVNGTEAVSPGPNADYFHRRGLVFRVALEPESADDESFLIVEHLDTNIALIEALVEGVHTVEPLAGGTCLRTGKPRRAVFRLSSMPDRDARIEILGVRSLTRISLQHSIDPGLVEEVRREEPREVLPKVQLGRPLQLVTTVGTDVKRKADLPSALEQMRALCPIAKTLGFSAVESYVKWNFVEPEPDHFDWSYYDAVVAEAQRHGLEWFPLLIVGSAYSLPPWFHDSAENVGFVCLEHGKKNNIQSIFTNLQAPHVQRFLTAFGEHYGSSDALLGVRLGPSGNYGESQYPAGGNWGYEDKHEHIHIGWWAGDAYAPRRFRAYLQAKYPTIAALNRAWDESYTVFNDVAPFIAQFAESPRKRKDFVDWYMDAMTNWCEAWAVWARQAMPNTDIYQSSGGWGFVESGTDFTDQTKSMAKVHGGIRATNETDSYAQNFYATRMMSSAARFYEVPFGSEPAGYGSARGLVARLYNIIVNDGQHLFYYAHNLLNNDQAVDKWLKFAPLLDQRGEPFIEVAALYPDTMGKLDDALFRNLYAFTFNSQVAALRPKLDFDFCSERMILDGALSRYKVLLLLWNPVIEREPLEHMDAWVREGGIVFVAQWRFQAITTVEGDRSVYSRWQKGDVGKGIVVFIPDDREPPHRLADALARELGRLDGLDPRTRGMLQTEKPTEVYVSVLTNGSFVMLNYNDYPATVQVPGLERVEMEPYSIAVLPSSGAEHG